MSGNTGRMQGPIVLVVYGRPSPYSNGPYESAWRQTVASQALLAFPEPFPATVHPLRIEIEFRMIPSRRGDLDNLAKPVLDTLFCQSRESKHPVAHVFLCDDCVLDELVLRRTRVSSVEEEGATIRIF